MPNKYYIDCCYGPVYELIIDNGVAIGAYTNPKKSSLKMTLEEASRRMQELVRNGEHDIEYEIKESKVVVKLNYEGKITYVDRLGGTLGVADRSGALPMDRTFAEDYCKAFNLIGQYFNHSAEIEELT